MHTFHCVKSVPIRSFSGPYFPAFGLNMERYSVSLRIQSECEHFSRSVYFCMNLFYTAECASEIEGQMKNESLNFQTSLLKGEHSEHLDIETLGVRHKVINNS